MPKVSESAFSFQLQHCVDEHKFKAELPSRSFIEGINSRTKTLVTHCLNYDVASEADDLIVKMLM